MRGTEELLAELDQREVRLWLDGDTVRCSAPKNVLTASLKAELTEHKARIATILRDSEPPRSEAGPLLGDVPREGMLPLAAAQERLWSLAQLSPESCVYNVSTAFRLDGLLDVEALAESLRAIQERHEVLRTSFPAQDGKPHQLISPDASIALSRTDLSHLASGEWEAAVQEALVRDMKEPFDLASAPLWRCRLLRLAPDAHVLSLVMHHIIYDGGSKEVFLAELSSLYAARARGGEALAELPLQYADFALYQNAWLEGEDADRQLSYWTERLAGSVAELSLPTDRARPMPPYQGGAQPFEIPYALADRLAARSREEQVSVYIALVAAFNALLNRYTGQQDLLVCSPAACRDDQRLENLIGYFNNVVALRTDLSGNPTLRELLGRTRETILGASAHLNLPFQRVSALPHLARTPLTRGMFSFRSLSGQTFQLEDLTVQAIDVRRQEPDFDLAMYMEERDGRLTGILEYNADLFDSATIDTLLRNFEVVIEALGDDPDGRLDKLPRFGIPAGDVEALLCRHAKIDEAVVIERLDRPWAHSSVAYLVLNEDDVPSLDEIRSYLRSELAEYRVPGALIPLDQIPLGPDGTLDEAALPSPPLTQTAQTAVGRKTAVEHVAPGTPLERQIAEIWARVLWLDREIGIHETFVDLGGHSLLSVQLVAEVESLLGRRLPVRAMRQMGTIAGFAAAIEGEPEATESDTPPESGSLAPDILHDMRAHVATWEGERVHPDALIVGLNTQGSKQAVFWCLQRYGELTQLAKHLGDDQPVYGMRSGVRVMEKTQDNIDALAEHHLEEILAIQPEGPFVIGGNCQAAQIAFQVASGLRARGHEITLLFLLEKFVAKPYAGRVALYFGEFSDRNPKLYYRDPEQAWRRYYTGPLATGEVPGPHREFFREPNVQGLTETLRSALEQAQSAPAPDSDGLDASLLPDSAYRAEVSAAEIGDVNPGEELKLRVTITNASDVAWPSYEQGGIALGNRWLDPHYEALMARGPAVQQARGQLAPEDRGVPAVGSRAPLPAELAPGASARLELRVTAPSEPGRVVLELDLVEEGVTWFRQMGSKPLRFEVMVRGRQRLTTRLRNARSVLRTIDRSWR
jgi:acyl carrier protein